MPHDLSNEAENLLVDLLIAEEAIDRARGKMVARHVEIAEALTARLQHVPPADLPGARKAAAEEMVAARRGKFRSELADLAADLVRADRRRAIIMRRLEAFPQLGESAPAIELAVEHDGERGFTIRTGGGKVSRFTLPAIIDRGVWRADGQYAAGDAVTSDGSLWVAREDGPAHEPGKGPQWRLAVMRGRNGRDAKPR